MSYAQKWYHSIRSGYFLYKINWGCTSVKKGGETPNVTIKIFNNYFNNPQIIYQAKLI